MPDRPMRRRTHAGYADEEMEHLMSRGPVGRRDSVARKGLERFGSAEDGQFMFTCVCTRVAHHNVQRRQMAAEGTLVDDAGTRRFSSTVRGIPGCVRGALRRWRSALRRWKGLSGMASTLADGVDTCGWRWALRLTMSLAYGEELVRPVRFPFLARACINRERVVHMGGTVLC